jgi:hypothetical protein
VQQMKPLANAGRLKWLGSVKGVALTVEDAHDIPAQGEFNEQIKREQRAGGVGGNEGQPSVRRCGTCGNTGHNSQTCQEDIEVLSSSDSE